MIPSEGCPSEEDLLVHLARNLQGARLLLVGTYRDVEVDRMERAPVHSTTVVRYRELFRWALVLGILALFGEFALVAWKAPLP